MKNILFGSLVAISLMLFSTGCYGEKAASNTISKVSKSSCATCASGKKCNKCATKKLSKGKCGADGKCGAGKCGSGKSDAKKCGDGKCGGGK